MVINKRKHSENRPAKQGAQANSSEPNKIGASTPYDFKGKNLTAYGGLLPVAIMLERLGFQQLVEEVVTFTRQTRVMTAYQFVLGMVLSIYVGFSRLYHLRFLEREPMLVGILKIVRLPPQSTFWRFLASLHLNVPAQLLEVQRQMRQRVWDAANVKLETVTLDTDTTVHTLFGNQMGARKGYNPKHRGKKSYQPILTFLHETKEYICGELRTGDRPDGKQIRKHLEKVFASLAKSVKRILARVDSGFYCWEAVETYERYGAEFILSAMKTPRLVDELKAADWKPSPSTDADGQCEFWYQPEGWKQAYRFIALRYEKKAEPKADEPEQYQLFETAEYKYRAFVTNMKDAIDKLAWFYDQRAGAENLIKEANNDAGLAAHPSGRWIMNCNHFQLAMLAYNLNCWLLLFNRDEKTPLEKMEHTRLSTARLRFLFVAAKIWRHAGRVGVRYSDHYAEKGLLQRLMTRLRAIAASEQSFLPVLATPLVE
jgi:DDE family transposase